MGHMWRVDPLHGMAAKIERFAIPKHARGAIRHIANGSHSADLPAQGQGARRGGEKPVQRSALIALEMRQADIAQALQGDHPRNGFADFGKELARAGMKQKRGVIRHKKLVE